MTVRDQPLRISLLFRWNSSTSTSTRLDISMFSKLRDLIGPRIGQATATARQIGANDIVINTGECQVSSYIQQ